MGFMDIVDPFGIFETKTTDPRMQRVETLSEEQKQLLQALTQQQQGLLNAPGQRFPGDIVPQAGPLSQQLQQQAGGLLGQAGQALQGFGQPLTAEALQQGSQPFLDSLMGQFQQQVVPDIAGQFGALGAARSSSLGEAIGRQASGLPGQAQQQFLNQRNIGIQQGFQGFGAGGQVAGQQDFLNQLFAGGQFQNFQLGLPGADPRTRNLGQALGTPAFGNFGIPGTETPSLFSQIAPAIGPAMMMMSDVRMKENIKPITNALDKVAHLAGSTYNYRFAKDRNGGVMAQDLEAILPDAVSEINGVKFVRYDAVIGLLVNAVNELRQEIRR